MSTAHSNQLTVEIELYEIHKAGWRENHRDEFVVIKDKDVLGFFASFHDAYCAGAEKYGLNANFLVRRILPKEPTFVVFGQ